MMAGCEVEKYAGKIIPTRYTDKIRFLLTSTGFSAFMLCPSVPSSEMYIFLARRCRFQARRCSLPDLPTKFGASWILL